MPQLSLSDYIELVSSTSKSIRSIAADSESSQSEFFTNAALRAPLGDLIREADPSEVGLFTLAPPSAYQNTSDSDVPASGAQITRADLPNATPLKPMTRRTGKEGRAKDHEPEVYANAALKYLDRYQSIQPMPRARSQAEHILEKLANLRQNIDKLNEKVKQSEPVDSDAPSVAPQALIKEEEQKIANLQVRIAELRKQKEALLMKKKPLVPGPSLSRAKPKLPSSPPQTNMQDESFWNTPGIPQRTMNFAGDLLLNETVDLNDVSIASFSSPVPTRISSPPSGLSVHPPIPDQSAEDPSVNVEETDEPPDIDDIQTTPTAKIGSSRFQPPSPSPPPPQPVPELPLKSEPVSALQTPANGTPSSSKQQRVRITMDTEKIVAKIWSTVGETIMPGYQANMGGGKAPKAKETIALLQSLSAKSPAPPSPSASGSLSSLSSATQSPSDQPSTQQIMTAHLLLALLSSPPSYSMSLNKIKEALVNNSSDGETSGEPIGGAGLTHTRALYACVAKRLIKIERGKGEQVVKFDV